MILEGSRYANALVQAVTAADGVTSPAVYWYPRFPTGSFIYYTVQIGDRLDILANRYFNNPELWWQIANANPEVFYPDDLDVGTVIRIPASAG